MRLIGLMSGTSADGVDACLAEIDEHRGRLDARVEAFLTVPYPTDLRQRVLGVDTVEELCRLNFELGELFARAALEVCDEARIKPADVDAVGSHGQTVCHVDEAPDHATLQIGEPSVIAERTGITTVADFRPRDIAAGGHGAPLVPIVDFLLLADDKTDRVALNIGGIANITVLPAGCTADQVTAFDTGPGNMVIDGVMELMTQGHKLCDRDGELAARGTVHEGMITLMLEHPYFSIPPPKSTGREQFGIPFARAFTVGKGAGRQGRAHVAATATAFAARTIADAIRKWASDGECEVIASGGGVHNRTMMRMLREQLPSARVTTSDQFGIPADAKEALAFAVLAYLTLGGRPGNVPGATGARRPVVLGKIVPATGTLLPPGRPARRDESPTEQANPASQRIDEMSPREIVGLINTEDAGVAEAVRAQLDEIASVIDLAVERLRRGGRLFYVGCGTSGRLGVLDASECPPTFGTEPEMVQGIIAGGPAALVRSSEGKEDIAEDGAAALDERGVCADDVVIGIAACGLTPYVHGALGRARELGAATALITCNETVRDAIEADVVIAPAVGPEVLAGSTRLKAGTATKMILNMITTASMARLGKVYGNLMVDLSARSSKLRSRAIRIFKATTDVADDDAAWATIQAAGGHVKTAIVMHQLGLSRGAADRRLADCHGFLRRALEAEG